MDASEIFVVVGAAILIVLVLWYFFGATAGANASPTGTASARKR